MLSNLLTVDGALRTFFYQLTDAIGFGGYLGIIIAVEVLFILLFAIKSIFSYEHRLKRSLDKANAWLFKNKKLDTTNIKQFNDIVKKGPKRFAYYWQQFMLNRDGGPTAYMTEDNIIEKPLRTSSWKNNVKNLSITTGVWAVISFVLGIASQQTFEPKSFAVALILPSIVLLLGLVAIIAIKGRRVLNLDDIYHLYHIFSRFVTNACDSLPPYIDFNLLFTPKEIENGNVQIREYYEEMARKAKEEFEEAKKNETTTLDYNFRGVGMDGNLLLERAMKESEEYIAVRSATRSQIAQIDAQKEALRRNYEDVQMDLQRKLQASKENIQKLIEQQSTTTNRFEIGRLRERQDKEVKRQEQLQSDYNQEETKFQTSVDELDKEIERLSRVIVECLDKAEKGMIAEYQSFFKKVMKSAYSVADSKVKAEKRALTDERDTSERELINVQTQNKRLLDENVTLRARIDELTAANNGEEKTEGNYDNNGNFVYVDGSFHDERGYFHDVDGKVYDMNGMLVDEKGKEAEDEVKEEDLINEQIDNFGTFVDVEEKAPEVVEQDLKAVEELLDKPLTDTDAVDMLFAEEKASEPVADLTETETPVAVEPEKQEETPAQPALEAEEAAEDDEEAAQTDEVVAEKKGRGRPKKEVTEPVSDVPKKRGRPRKEVEEPISEEPKKRGRSRKNAVATDDDIAKINELISAEEERFNGVKAMLDDSINEAMGSAGAEREKEEIIASVEALREQAESMREGNSSSEELAKVNKRIEDLIKALTSIND